MPAKVSEQRTYVFLCNQSGFERHDWASQPVSGDSRLMRWFGSGIQGHVTNLLDFVVACRTCNHGW